ARSGTGALAGRRTRIGMPVILGRRAGRAVARARRSAMLDSVPVIAAAGGRREDGRKITRCWFRRRAWAEARLPPRARPHAGRIRAYHRGGHVGAGGADAAGTGPAGHRTRLHRGWE